MIQLIALMGLLIGVVGMSYVAMRKSRELKVLATHTPPDGAFVTSAINIIAPKLKFDFKKISIQPMMQKVKDGAWFKKTLIKSKIILLKLENKIDVWLKKISHSKK